MSHRPWLWLIAGPNGAGKTTYSSTLREVPVINTDEQAERLSPGAPEKAAVAAARLSLDAMKSFVYDTTEKLGSNIRFFWKGLWLWLGCGDVGNSRQPVVWSPGSRELDLYLLNGWPTQVFSKNQTANFTSKLQNSDHVPLGVICSDKPAVGDLSGIMG